MGPLGLAHSGVRFFVAQNPFRSPPSGSSLRDGGLSYDDYAEQLAFWLIHLYE